VRVHASDRSSGGIEFVGAISNITGRKEAEQRLQQQETELRQVLDLTPQLIAVFGPPLERLYANRMSLDYFGVPRTVPDVERRQMSGFGLLLHLKQSNCAIPVIIITGNPSGR
jgi:PAS domain-containing protein